MNVINARHLKRRTESDLASTNSTAAMVFASAALALLAALLPAWPLTMTAVGVGTLGMYSAIRNHASPNTAVLALLSVALIIEVAPDLLSIVALAAVVLALWLGELLSTGLRLYESSPVRRPADGSALASATVPLIAVLALVITQAWVLVPVSKWWTVGPIIFLAAMAVAVHRRRTALPAIALPPPSAPSGFSVPDRR